MFDSCVAKLHAIDMNLEMSKPYKLIFSKVITSLNNKKIMITIQKISTVEFS